MEKENKYDIVKDVTLEVGKMAWNDTKERLELQTNKGQITIKGKKSITENVRGLPVIKAVPYKIDDLPQKVFDFIKVINKKGYILIKASYTCMTTYADEEESKYRFSDFKQFENWEQEETTKTPEGDSSPSPLPKKVDCILPRSYTEKNYNTFLYKRDQLKDKLSLGILSYEDYDKELAKLKQELKEGLNASE